MSWATVLVASAVCFLLKVAGYALPGSWLAAGRVQQVAAVLPVALLAALVGVQTFAGPTGALTVDARAAGVAAGVVALLVRAPFLVVVVVAAGVAALVRATGLLG